MNHGERQVQELAALVHAGLLIGHLLGFAYNLKRRNRFDVFAHGLAATYDAWALRKHLRCVTEDV